MKEEFIGLMCCPVCRGELEVEVKKKEGDDIIEGTMKCTKCKATYDIKDGIPYMIVEK